VHRPQGTLAAFARGAGAPTGRLAAFEEAAARAFGVPHAVATGSGREAQALILSALDLAPGDEVLVPALTFHAVPATIARLGLKPVYVEVDPTTLLMDLRDLEARLGPRSRVVIGTHLMGLACDLDGLRDLCDRRGLVLVEDFAQAAGATYRGRPLGSFGAAAFTSLETVKPLNAFGGGLVTTTSAALAARVRAAADGRPGPDPVKLGLKVALGQLEALLAHPTAFGWLAWPLMGDGRRDGLIARYKARKKGAANHHVRLHPGQAEVGRHCLASLEAHLTERRRNAEALLALLPPDAWRPAVVAGSRPSYYQLVVRSEQPERCVSAARAQGVDVGRNVVEDVSGGACPVAARVAREALQLPCHPGLRPDELQRVARAVSPWLLRGPGA